MYTDESYLSDDDCHVLRPVRVADMLPAIEFDRLAFTRADVHELARGVQGNTSLVSLVLQGMLHRGVGGAEPVLRCLHPRSPLRCLALRNVGLRATDCATLALFLPLHALGELDLFHNEAMGNEGVATVAALLPRSVHLTKLRLAAVGLGPAGCEALVRHLADSCVQELDVGDNRIGDLGVAVLAQQLVECKLIDLSLAWCDVGPAGCRALQTLLPHSSLMSLDLGGNLLGGDGCGVDALAQCLAGCGLTRLGLSSTHSLRTNVLATLVQAVMGSCLQSLDLHYSNRGSRGGWPLQVALTVCDELDNSPYRSACRVPGVYRCSPMCVGDVVVIANVVMLSGILPWLAAHPIQLYNPAGGSLYASHLTYG